MQQHTTSNPVAQLQPARRSAPDAYAALASSLRKQAATFRFVNADDADYFARAYRGRRPSPMPMVETNLSVVEQELIERAVVRCAVAEILTAYPLRLLRIHDGFEYVAGPTRCVETIMKAVMSTNENTMEVLSAQVASGLDAVRIGIVRFRYGVSVGSVVDDATLNISLARTDALAAGLADIM